MIFELDYSNQEKELLEGQRRYREQMNTQYVAGYTDAEEKCKAELAKLKALIAEKEATIAEKEALIAERKAIIAEKKAELEKYKKSNK